MRILEKFQTRENNLLADLPVIAFLGDSVTQGCFEVYFREDGNLDTIFESEHSYPRLLAKRLASLYPRVPAIMINAGISGDSAVGGWKRLEKDILSHKPDLTIVSFGLNDCMEGNLVAYKEHLNKIFLSLKENGSEVIFLTENMMNTRLHESITNEKIKNIAKIAMEKQNNGEMESFVNTAKQVSKKCGVVVCDCYEIWKNMSNNGVDITSLLSNKINHPTREMYQLFADELLKVLLEK